MSPLASLPLLFFCSSFESEPQSLQLLMTSMRVQMEDTDRISLKVCGVCKMYFRKKKWHPARTYRSGEEACVFNRFPLGT